MILGIQKNKIKIHVYTTNFSTNLIVHKKDVYLLPSVVDIAIYVGFG